MKDIINEKMKIESMKHITKKTGLATLKDPEFFYVPLSQHNFIIRVPKSFLKYWTD